MQCGQVDAFQGVRMTPGKCQSILKSCTDILNDRPTGHLCTMCPDGRPSVNPVCVMWDGEHIRISTQKARMKYQNLLRDARVALSIPHRNNPNRYVEIRGTAQVTDDADRAFIRSVARTFLAMDEYPFDQPGDERAVITIFPEHVSSPQVPLEDAPPTAPEAERNKQVARDFIAAINRCDVQAIAATYAEDGVCWTAGTMPISGTFTRDQVVAASRRVLEVFPQGLTITIKRMTAEEDRVAIEAESHGQHVSGRPYHNEYHFLMRLRA